MKCAIQHRSIRTQQDRIDDGDHNSGLVHQRIAVCGHFVDIAYPVIVVVRISIVADTVSVCISLLTGVDREGICDIRRSVIVVIGIAGVAASVTVVVRLIGVAD